MQFASDGGSFPAESHLLYAQGGAPARRPNVIIPCSGVESDAHLPDNFTERLRVPADGQCLYHCLVASEDMLAWVHCHSMDMGVAIGAGAGEYASRAAAIRQELISHYRSVNKEGDAARLEQEGPSGYPEMDDLKALAEVIGGQIILQVSDQQVVYGLGPLLMHIASAVAWGAGVFSASWGRAGQTSVSPTNTTVS